MMTSTLWPVDPVTYFALTLCSGYAILSRMLSMKGRPRGFRYPPEDRFFRLVDFRPGGCWLWKGYLHLGYGRFNDGQRIVRAHRWAYENLVGQIPDAMQVDHLCRCRACVNPDHMELVTQKENIMRGISPASRQYATRTHCLHGHLLDGVYHRGNQRVRYCKTCNRENARRQRRRLRELRETVSVE